jgi:hypothetical protein
MCKYYKISFIILLGTLLVPLGYTQSSGSGGSSSGSGSSSGKSQAIGGTGISVVPSGNECPGVIIDCLDKNKNFTQALSVPSVPTGTMNQGVKNYHCCPTEPNLAAAFAQCTQASPGGKYHIENISPHCVPNYSARIKDGVIAGLSLSLAAIVGGMLYQHYHTLTPDNMLYDKDFPEFLSRLKNAQSGEFNPDVKGILSKDKGGSFSGWYTSVNLPQKYKILGDFMQYKKENPKQKSDSFIAQNQQNPMKESTLSRVRNWLTDADLKKKYDTLDEHFFGK